MAVKPPLTNPKIGDSGRTGHVTIGHREAFHVPAVWVCAHGTVKPGDSVRFTDNTCDVVEMCEYDAREAIVDPFCHGLKEDECFWVLLVPGKVEKFTHVFEIAGRPAPEPIDDSDDSCRGCW